MKVDNRECLYNLWMGNSQEITSLTRNTLTYQKQVQLSLSFDFSLFHNML